MSNLKALTLPFPEEEIEWRIGQCGKKGNGQIWAMCLAYVQARAIMNRLDEVAGPGGWRVSYRLIPKADGIDAGVIAQLAIKVGDEWVMKEDGAEQTDIESFKGGLSSALKRAGSAWGIGRYLYGLDSGFAQIVQSGTNGARWAKTKDGAEFYWVPPRLPQWALPNGHEAGPQGVAPGKPGLNDGVPPTGVQAWKFTFGQWNRKSIEEVYRDPKYGREKLISWIDWLADDAKKTGKPLTQNARDAIAEVERFLGALENGSFDVGATG